MTIDGETKAIDRFDRQSKSIPSIDEPWDNPVERADRMESRKGDRSSHRAYHSLYEDMLN